jgi:hypothetical protein
MSPSSDGGAGQALAAPALVRALQYLLRPLVRLLLLNHVTYPVFCNLLKGIYVEMGVGEFSSGEQRLSDSRLSLLTGIHRKDIKRLRAEPAQEYRPPPSVSLGARLVAQWTGAGPFLDENGRPLVLARLEGSSGAPSFADLVSSVSTDIRPRSVLDEWLRLGIVEIEDDQRVRLRVEAFVPEKGFDEKSHYFGRNLHDHIAAAAHNLEARGLPMLERSVYYDRLSPESVQELADLSERLGMEALQKVNRRAMRLQKKDASGRAARLRMNFGIYFFHGTGKGRPGRKAGADA